MHIGSFGPSVQLKGSYSEKLQRHFSSRFLYKLNTNYAHESNIRNWPVSCDSTCNVWCFQTPDDHCHILTVTFMELHSKTEQKCDKDDLVSPQSVALSLRVNTTSPMNPKFVYVATVSQNYSTTASSHCSKPEESLYSRWARQAIRWHWKNVNNLEAEDPFSNCSMFLWCPGIIHYLGLWWWREKKWWSDVFSSPVCDGVLRLFLPSYAEGWLTDKSSLILNIKALCVVLVLWRG